MIRNLMKYFEKKLLKSAKIPSVQRPSVTPYANFSNVTKNCWCLMSSRKASNGCWLLLYYSQELGDYERTIKKLQTDVP